MCKISLGWLAVVEKGILSYRALIQLNSTDCRAGADNRFSETLSRSAKLRAEKFHLPIPQEQVRLRAEPKSFTSLIHKCEWGSE